MAKFSPQSQAVANDLLHGNTVVAGPLTLGPLNDQAALVLNLFLTEYDTLIASKGIDQAKLLRRRFMEETSKQKPAPNPAASPSDPQPSQPTSLSPQSPPPAWRLLTLKAQSIRGIAPPGQSLEFSFDGKSNLIYGPNGSGKSSLLGAVVWVLTGTIVTDADDPQQSAPIYDSPQGGTRPRRIRDWPVVATLPNGADYATADPTPYAEIHLRTPDNSKNLILRRTTTASLEASQDGQSWAPCPDLAAFNIAPLDIQLSITAPTIFGRRSLESAPDARTILTLLLGYDDLENLGNLATALLTSRTRLENIEADDINGKWEALRNVLATIPDTLPENSPVKQELTTLAANKSPTITDIVNVGKNVADAIATAGKHIASLVGLTATGSNALAGLAETLTKAVGQLEKGLWANLPLLDALRLDVALSADPEHSPAQRLQALVCALATFAEQAKTKIGKRHAWWKKESQDGPRLNFLLEAAKHYDPHKDACPVCDRSVSGLPVKIELQSLKVVDPNSSRALTDFFRDLQEDLSAIVSPTIRQLATSAPADRLLADWTALQADPLGPTLRPLADAFTPKVNDLAATLIAHDADIPTVLPVDSAPQFHEAAKAFLRDLAAAYKSVAILNWSQSHLAVAEKTLTHLLIAATDNSKPSLLQTLSKGKAAAAEVKPLAEARKALLSAHDLRKALTTLEEQFEALKQLKAPLDTLKHLRTYASNHVETISGLIAARTTENWAKLYDESPTGLTPAPLSIGKGRDTSIESRLDFTTYQVPGKYFANAGLQRAIALSFYFALLDKHPHGLGFLLIDDPILSLDEDHRERWSTHLLRPAMDSLQIILATHQRQYLRNCRNDFDSQCVVELNPRDTSMRLSWRPGDRLMKAQRNLETEWAIAPTTMRKYREELLITLSAYSPEPFFDPANLTNSFNAYAKIKPPHPLAGQARDRIVARLQKPQVSKVLDPGSHAMTEDDVTKPMAQDCLDELLELDKAFRSELIRLARLREHNTRGKAIVAPIIPFPNLPITLAWGSSIPISVLGRAAARADNRMVIDSAEQSVSSLTPGAAVLVTGHTLEPVALSGQWVLLAPEADLPRDGDLVAISDADDNRYLRQVWSNQDEWILQSINPVKSTPCITCPKIAAGLRRIIGVVYVPNIPHQPPPQGKTSEWQPIPRFVPTTINHFRAVIVEGDSLDPLARRGQQVLVSRNISPNPIPAGDIAVVATDDPRVGDVIKRVFPHGNELVLLSPNPVDPLPPIIVAVNRVRELWPVVGVLFEAAAPPDAIPPMQ